MTPTDLRAVILAARMTNSGFARAIGLQPRQMRNLLAGKSAITPGVISRINHLLGAAGAPGREWPRDAWIVGHGPEPERRRYIIHMGRPRFAGRVVAVDPSTGAAATAEQPADTQTGICHEAGAGAAICEIVWIDPAPADPAALARLMEGAAAHLEQDAGKAMSIRRRTP